MKIFYSPKFPKLLKKLPQDIQELFFVQEIILRENWQDSRLHTKKLKGAPVLYSFRITRIYRVLFYFQKSDEIVLFSVGHRSKIYD